MDGSQWVELVQPIFLDLPIKDRALFLKPTLAVRFEVYNKFKKKKRNCFMIIIKNKKKNGFHEITGRNKANE